VSWIKDALRAIRSGISTKGAEMPEGPSHCGCILPEGFWGDSGWHFTRYDAQRLYTTEKWAFAKQRPYMSREAIRREWAAWLDAEEEAGRIGPDGLLDRLRTYLGLPVAVERCPAYDAAVNRGEDRST
jgi:hypothetical protein